MGVFPRLSLGSGWRPFFWRSRHSLLLNPTIRERQGSAVFGDRAHEFGRGVGEVDLDLERDFHFGPNDARQVLDDLLGDLRCIAA